MEWFNRVFEEIKGMDIVKEKNSNNAEILGEEELIKVEKRLGEKHPQIVVYEVLGGTEFIVLNFDIPNQEFYILQEIKFAGDRFLAKVLMDSFGDIEGIIRTGLSNF